MNQLSCFMEEHNTLAKIHLAVILVRKLYNSTSHLESRKILLLDVLWDIFQGKIREIVALIGK